MIEKQTDTANYPIFIYDKEWVDLIIEAKQMGLSMNEIRNFLLDRQSYES